MKCSFRTDVHTAVDAIEKRHVSMCYVLHDEISRTYGSVLA